MRRTPLALAVALAVVAGLLFTRGQLSAPSKVPISPTASITLTPTVPSPTAQALAPAEASSEAVAARPTATSTPTVAATPTAPATLTAAATPTPTTAAAVTVPPEAPYPGAMAPDFTLDSAQGSPVTLSHYRGKSSVVLVFYQGST